MSSVLGRARVAPPPPRAFVICYCPHHPSRPPGRSHASPAPARGTVKPDRSKWISVEERRCRLSVKLRPRQEEGDPSPESTSFSAGVGSWGGRTSLLWQNEFNGGKNYWIAGELQENCRKASVGTAQGPVDGKISMCLALGCNFSQGLFLSRHFLLARWVVVECNHPMYECGVDCSMGRLDAVPQKTPL